MANENPLVSIGLPVYNGGDYLRQTLEDLLAQSYTNFELIISDNASTDETETICRQATAQDSRIRYVRQPQNIGGAPNHNITYSLARGEYFKWVGHDDRHTPTYLEMCQTVANDGDVALVYPKTLVINEAGDFLYNYEDNFHMTSDQPYLRLRRVLEQPNSELLNPSLGLFRRAIFDRRQPDGGYFASDRVILAEVALHGRFHELPERLFSRRIYTQSSYWSAGSDEQVQRWFDPASKGKVMAPRWKKFVGYFSTIGRAPLTTSQRSRCYFELLRFYLKADRISGALMDFRLIKRRLFEHS